MTILFTVDNSMSKIEGLDAAQERALRDLLSYDLDPQSAYFGGSARPMRRCLMDKKGNFPSGLVATVKTHLRLGGVKHTFKDLRIRPISPTTRFPLNLGPTPYEDQQKAILAAFSASRGTISMATGFGKSITMALLIHKLQLKTLVVVPNLGLKRQLQATFDQILGRSDQLVVENIDSKRLEKLTDFDVLIIDESHHVAASTYRRLNKKAWTGIYHRYFFTATPFRSKDEERMLMESISGQVIYEVGYHRAVEVGAIVPVEAYYYELPKIIPKGNTKSWPAMYSELVVNNRQRNELIAKLMRRLVSNDISTLCLVKEIKHGENLFDLTGCAFANGVSAGTPIFIEAFNDSELTALIGTTGVLGEGVDTKPAEFVIIAGLGKSKNQFMQCVGRGVRRFKDKQSCKVILIKDSSHPWTLKHFKAQVKYLNDEYGVIPVKLDI